MRRFFLSILLSFAVPAQSFAGIYFSSLLPNPEGDDTLGEYIEIKNTGCELVDISGYILSDLGQKTYTFPSNTTIASHENSHFLYATTKIALNNSGDEAVFLKDTHGNMIDEVHYSGTQKDNVVITLSVTDETCINPEQSDTGSTDSSTGEVLTDSGSISGTGEILSDFGSGEILSDSGSIISSSGSFQSGTGETENTGTGETSSGVLQVEEASGSVYTETGTLTPLEMYYADSDGNSRIDTLEILYPYVLTGVVNTGAIELYSNTGGLFSYRINTFTGYIVSGYLSGNTLILRILEGDREKTTLKVNNTTSSELRLKSTGELGFRSIGGQVPEDFFLTKSFDEYRKVYSTSPQPCFASSSEGVVQEHSCLHLSPQGEGVIGTGNIESGSGVSFQEESGITETGVVTFPEIIPTFQNYTNTTNSGDTLTCTTMPCRVNFTLEPIFTGVFLEKDFTCQIIFGTGVYNTCNPPQLYPTSSGSIDIVLVDKASGTSTGKIISIVMNLATSGNITGMTAPANNRAPIASIDMDGKWKKYFTSPEVNLLRCYAFTCSVNFTGEHSYDPDGDDIRILWLYDYANISTSRDPGIRTFSIGTHTVVLRVIDSYGAAGEVKYTIEVMHPDLMPEEEIEKIEKKEKVEKKKVGIKKTTKKKKKMKPVVFFDAPDILLQNKHPENIQMAGNRYICRTKTKTCSINFTLTGAQNGYTYEWSFPGQSGSYISKNPRSFAFLVGTSEVKLVIRDLAGNIMHDETITVLVEKTSKTRSSAKKSAKGITLKVQKESPKKQEEILHPEMYIPTESEGASMMFLIFLAGSGLSGLLAIRKRGKENINHT